MVFTGYVSPEDLLRYYHTCDVFCAPSTGQESFGIVCSRRWRRASHRRQRIPGYQEVVRHGQEGCSWSHGRVALALSLVHVLADADLRERLRGPRSAAGRAVLLGPHRR